MDKLLYFTEFLSLNEAKKKKLYDYGCLMLYFKIPTKIKNKLFNDIDKKDLFKKDNPKYGLEKESHCTLLYGLHSDKIENDNDVFDSISKLKFSKIKLHNVSFFDNPEYDVLKFDIIGSDLHKANKILTKNFPFTTDFPKYHPHSTIGYLKKGKGEEYLDKFKDLEINVIPEKLVYSKPDGTKIYRSLIKE